MKGKLNDGRLSVCVSWFQYFPCFMKHGRRHSSLIPAGLVFVAHICCRPGQRPPGCSSYLRAGLHSSLPRLLHAAVLSDLPSAFAPQHTVIFSKGEGHTKGITLSLDVRFRRHLREIWCAARRPLASPRRTRVRVSSAHRKTKRRNTDGTFYNVRRAC